MRYNEVLTAAFIAKKNIAKNKKTLLLTILIIALGFISSVIIYGVLKDTGYDLQENFIEMTIGHILIESYDETQKLENYKDITRKIKQIPEIKKVSAIQKKPIIIQDNEGETIRTETRIVKPEEYTQTSDIQTKMIEGEWLNKGEEGKIIMGCVSLEHCNPTEEYERINANLGEQITIITEEGNKKILILQGIYKHQFTDIELTPYLTETTAKKIYEDYNTEEADQIIIRLEKREQTNKVVKEIQKLNINAKIITWEEKIINYSSIIDSFSIIGNLSFGIGMIISAISIYVILYINILHKRTQIGIIKALGIQSNIIQLSYILLSLFIAIIGTIGGILLTNIVILYFSFNPMNTGIGNLVPQVTMQAYILVSIAIILLSTITGYLVSQKITKQNIITAITNG